jgi:N-glycosylase/DNA lyase
MSESRRLLSVGEGRQGAVSAPNFDLRESMDCGQIFGWQREGRTYSGVIGDVGVTLKQSGGQVHYVSEAGIPPDRIVTYLGLDEDLGAIQREIARDGFMRRVVTSVRGLRIIKQDMWPCLCSYILSAQNRVERIDKLVKEIASTFGRAHNVNERTVYGLPEPRDLARCGESGIRSCGAGFRAPYLIEAAIMIARGEIDLEAIRAMDESHGREALKKLPGVGDKVADCVQLFAFAKYGAFPVDVWIKRAMERVYFHSCDVSPAEIRRFAQAYFGRYAGYAQEYIYSYARRFGLDW